jgi:hypothetical protein
MNPPLGDSIHITIHGVGWSPLVAHKLFLALECFADSTSAGFRYRPTVGGDWQEVVFTDGDLVGQVRAIYEAMLEREAQP